MNKKDKRRYNLHYKFRKSSELILDAKKRQIFVPKSKEEEIKQNKYAMLLKNEFNYVFQLTFM